MALSAVPEANKTPKIHLTVLWPPSPIVGQEKPVQESYEINDYDMAKFSANFVVMLGGKVVDIHEH